MDLFGTIGQAIKPAAKSSRSSTEQESRQEAMDIAIKLLLATAQGQRELQNTMTCIEIPTDALPVRVAKQPMEQWNAAKASMAEGGDKGEAAEYEARQQKQCTCETGRAVRPWMDGCFLTRFFSLLKF